MSVGVCVCVYVCFFVSGDVEGRGKRRKQSGEDKEEGNIM